MTPAHEVKNSLTGISSSTSDCAVKWDISAITSRRGTGKLGFRYSRNEGQDLSIGEVSQPGLRDGAVGYRSATAFNPFLGLNGHKLSSGQRSVYVTLHNSGEYELPIYYATFNGDLFNLPAGPVSFAIGGEYDAPRFTRDRDALNNTFSTIGSVDGQSFRVNRDIWGIYEEVRVPFTSPTWNFPGLLQLRGGLCRARGVVQHRTPRRCCLPDCSRRSRRSTASIMRRSRRYLSGGNRWIRSTSAR